MTEITQNLADSGTREPGDGFGSDVRDWESEPVKLTRAEATAAKTARDTAFETTVSEAGKVLEAELAAAGTDKALRRAAWARYGDVQDAAGAAYRAAQAAER
jgi:hypothetical protein